MSLEEMIEAAVERGVQKGVQRALEELRPREEAAELLTCAEAATLAKVSEDTVHRWVEKGWLNRYGGERKLRVRRDELLRMKPPGTQRSMDDAVAHVLRKVR